MTERKDGDTLIIIALILLGLGIFVIMVSLTISARKPRAPGMFVSTTPGYEQKYNFNDIITGLNHGVIV